jgi:hypothetical protein
VDAIRREREGVILISRPVHSPGDRPEIHSSVAGRRAR